MSSPQHDQATGYRKQAAAARAVATSVSLNDVKQKLLETARRLEAVAEEEERKARDSAPGPQPESDGPFTKPATCDGRSAG
jgi:hypothetical protein